MLRYELNRLFRVASALAIATLALIAVTPPPALARPPRVDEFSIGTGCQLSVTRSGSSTGRFILFSAGRYSVTPVIQYEMQIDGRRVYLHRIGQSQGSYRPGGRTTDRLRSEDGTIQVTLVANWRQGIEGLDLHSGTLRVTRNGETTRINVSGYQGC